MKILSFQTEKERPPSPSREGRKHVGRVNVVGKNST